MTEQELTNKIIKNAETTAAALIADAQNAAQTQLEQAKIAATAKKEAALNQAKKDLAQRETQLSKANEVEMIKAKINARQATLDQAFNQARTNLLNAKPDTIKKLVNALIKAYAAPKDTVMIAKAWSKAMPNLPTTAAIDSGIIIENSTYRLELSLDVLLANLREKNELDIARLLGVN